MANNNNNKHIYLYSDEFEYEVWEDYCKILGIDPEEAQEVKIEVASVEILNGESETNRQLQKMSFQQARTIKKNKCKC